MIGINRWQREEILKHQVAEVEMLKDHLQEACYSLLSLIDEIDRRAYRDTEAYKAGKSALRKVSKYQDIKFVKYPVISYEELEDLKR
jgi:hypothetical protein